MFASNNNLPNSNSPVDSIDMLSISRNIDEFKSLDENNQGYLDENQARSYFKTQCSSDRNCESIVSAAFDQTSQLSLEKFLIITHLLRLDTNEDSGSTNNSDENMFSSRFSALLRHCEEALQQVEKDRKSSSASLPASKVKLSAIIVQLESCWKNLTRSNTDSTFDKYDNDTDIRSQRLNSIDDEVNETHIDSSNNTLTSPHQNTVSSGTPEEVMPGSFDFDKTEEHEDKNKEDLNSASNVALMASPLVAPPRKSHLLSINSEGKIVTSPNSTYGDVNLLGEKEPELSQSFAAPSTQLMDTARERSMSNDGIASDKASNVTLPSAPHQASIIHSLNNVTTDPLSLSDDDNKREMEVLKEEDEVTDIKEPSTSITEGVIIPNAPTTVVPSRAAEDPIVESTDDNDIITISVPQHPMMQAELLSHPSFYSCNSYRSSDDSKSNEMDSEMFNDMPNEKLNRNPAVPHGENSSEQGAIDQNDVPLNSGFESSVQDAPQLVVPVTKSPILTDAQFSSLTGVGKSEADEKQVSSTTSVTNVEENYTSVLPLLAGPAIGAAALVKKDSKRKDNPSINIDSVSEDGPGAISPPPSFNSDVQNNTANNSSINTSQSGLNNAFEDQRGTVKEPLYQSVDAASPGVTEITESLDEKLDLIIEDSPRNTDEKLQSDSSTSPHNNALLSTQGLPMADNKRHSVVSVESRFIELEDDHVSPFIKNARQSNEFDASTRKKGLDTSNADIDTKEAPQVPEHSAVDLPPSPSSISSATRKANKRTTICEDKTLERAIKDTYEFLASPSKTKKGDRVLKVRNGFEGFCGLGIECVHDDVN